VRRLHSDGRAHTSHSYENAPLSRTRPAADGFAAAATATPASVFPEDVVERGKEEAYAALLDRRSAETNAWFETEALPSLRNRAQAERAAEQDEERTIAEAKERLRKK
jgi:hypothetical protein